MQYMDIEEANNVLVLQTKGNLIAAMNVANRELLYQRWLCGVIKAIQKDARRRGAKIALTESEREVFARACWLEQAHSLLNAKLLAWVEENC